MTIAAIQKLLKERVGLDPEVAGGLSFKRAADRRLNALGWTEDDLARYERLAATNPDELNALIEEVVVPESWFFRDEIPFAYLGQAIAEGRFARPDRGPLRILSIPCSRGEEPYSIAMTLDMAGIPARRFRIDAVDISRNAIHYAKEALYSENAFRSKNLEFRDRYFRKEGTLDRLVPKIRELVRFHEGNLLDDKAIPLNYDVIFCRNVLIYFDQNARAKSVRNLDKHLEPGGLLFLGHVEGIGILGKGFRSTGGSGAFAFERNVGATAEKSRAPRLIAEPIRKLETRVEPPSSPLETNGASDPVTEPTTPQEIDPPTLEHAITLADRGRLDEAAAICGSLLARNGPSASTFYLLGLVRQAEGERDEAVRCFEKCVYLEPTHEEALLALARIAEGRGDSKAAENLRRRADRARRETAS